LAKERVLISRRAARESAVLVLYAQQCSHMPVGEVMNNVRILQKKVELSLGPGDDLGSYRLDTDSIYAKFLKDLVLKTIRDTEVIDEIITEKAHKWDLDRIARLDRIILRIGISEMLHFPDIPEKVSINEAIEISKKYSTEKSGKFINGILDNVKTEIVSLREKYA
jgi:transcription antitermination protein NusB